MPDNTPFNTSLDLAAPKIADDEVFYSGDTAKVQIIQAAIVTGAEGAHVMTKIPGDSVLTQTISAGATDPATGIDLFGIKNWGILVPSNFDGTQISYKVASALAGTYAVVRDILNSPVIQTVTPGDFHDIPGEVLAARFVKVCAVTPQATDDSVLTILAKGL